MSRPITIAQTFAWIVTSLVGILFVASQFDQGLRWAEWFSKPAVAHASAAISSAPDVFSWNFLLLILSIGTVALLGGIVVYLASEKS